MTPDPLTTEDARKIVNLAYLLCLREIADADTGVILLGLRDEHLALIDGVVDLRTQLSEIRGMLEIEFARERTPSAGRTEGEIEPQSLKAVD